MLVLGRADLEALLEPRALIDALGDAFAAHAAGHTRVPPRTTVPVTDDGVLLLMPASASAADGLALGAKLVTVYPGNPARGAPTIQATYVLMDGATGTPLALARYLARRDARRLLCFGAGVQAGFQLQCLAAELPIEHVDVIGRDPERARRFAATWAARLGRPRSRSTRTRRRPLEDLVAARLAYTRAKIRGLGQEVSL